jgi:hypothetical protein
MWSAGAPKKDSDSDDDSEEDSSEEESDEDSDDAGPSNQNQSAAELSREERRLEKKARKEAAIAKAKGPVQVGDMPPSDSDDDEEEEGAAMPANPNHSRKARNQTKLPPKVEEVTEKVEKLSVAPSRREREAMEAAAAKERYRKLHEAGKTDEAKADLARLKLIREKREADAERKKVCYPQPWQRPESIPND